MLLGVGAWIRIIELEILRAHDNLTIAHKSKLGCIIMGNLEDPYKNQNPYIGAVSKDVPLKQLTEIIQRLWEIEDIPGERKRTFDEERCEEVFVNQHSRNKHGRCIVRIPFNDKLTQLGKSKMMTLRQFYAMENRMKKNPDFASKYRIFMTEYKALGHMSPVWDAKEESGYYTPHHGVQTSNKFRVVFNASATTSSGIALNETQLVAEKLQDDLIIILIIT